MNWEIFTDLLATPQVSGPIFGVSLLMAAVVLAAITYTRSVAEEEEALAEPEPDEYKVALVKALPADEGAQAQEQMRVMRPSAPIRPAWMDSLLNHYQFWMVLDGDRGVAILTDRRFFSLKNKTVELPFGAVVSADAKAMGRLLGRARFNVNRRAQAAGLLERKVRKH